MFKLFKGMFSHILMMGVSPVTMDDVIRGYGQAGRTQQLAAGTQLHLIVMQIRGWRMERMEEITG